MQLMEMLVLMMEHEDQRGRAEGRKGGKLVSCVGDYHFSMVKIGRFQCMQSKAR